MTFELILQSIGIIGIVISFIIIAKLSARMGEGLMLPPYYLLDYVATFIALSTIAIHFYLHDKYEMPHAEGAFLDMGGLYVSLLLISNIIVILVSFKYWRWLKEEILNRNKNQI